MANSKLLLASIAIALLIFRARSESSISGEIEEPEAARSGLRSQLDGLRSEISTLESKIEESFRKLKTKEDSIAQLHAIIEEKSLSIEFLKSEVESLQGALDGKKLAGKADGWVGELEKQILQLKNEIESQAKKKKDLESRFSKAEKRFQDLNLRLESLQNTNEEQKLRIRKTQRALELAEEELMRAQLEASSKFKELAEVHGAWLPPWLATHISYIQDLAVTHWNEHVKPVSVLILNKASQKLEEVQKWAEPHVDSARTKWIPAAKEQLMIFKSNAKPHLQRIAIVVFKAYEASKNTFRQHVVRIQEVAYPHLQDAREFLKPYIDKAVDISKPHIANLQYVVMPYKKHVARTYRKSLRTARTYHRQVQDSIHKKLKNHELTKPYATKELAWFLASALLVFPLFFLYRVLASAFCKKAKKPRQTAHASHMHRRPKRRHAEK
ncbi:uncharacterized protein LOC109840349 isoform X2 [Asparagus officinalis]|uniref:uncharacterized protein LOC109840349 isoform X2 n=1 Tax=Asparagus officinalis TaxID=4686 RepID=UPI00098E110D|nr:uncharacterized protein LOC109840349 isoform X2 [Asparagus officinalis]